MDEVTGEAIYYNPDGTTTRKDNRLAEITITPSRSYLSVNPSIGSNNNTGYVYNDRDLAVRESVLANDNAIARYLIMMENHGQFFILNGYDYWLTYGHTTGNLLLTDKYLAMQGLLTYQPGVARGPVGQRMNIPTTKTPSSPSSASTSLQSQQLLLPYFPPRGLLPQYSSVPRNSWNAFLRSNRGRYSGKNWQQQAVKDHRNQ